MKMNETIIQEVARELNIKDNQVKVVLDMLVENNTIPFIARYRKQQTQNLDENAIFAINKLYEYQNNLTNRKEDVIRLIDEKGLLSDDLKASIMKATKISEVDNIYQPFKDKKKTKASVAIGLGFEPLAKKVLSVPNLNIEQEIKSYLKDGITKEEGLQYVQDIIAQQSTDNPKVRAFVTDNIIKYAYVKAKVKKKHDDEQETFKIYYDYQEKYNRLVNHRILGLNRAVNKKVVTMSFGLDQDYNVENIYKYLMKKRESQNKQFIMEAIEDGYKRLLFPSITRFLWSEKVEAASQDAIDVFSLNLEKLLLNPPLKHKTILGLDPAFRTGCKLAVINENGTLLEISVCYPHSSDKQREEAKRIMLDLIKKHNVDIIAIGNGTASRESEEFVANLIKDNNLDVTYAIVSEAGASVYSASKLAQDEFKDLSVEQRSAISIARRLLDPLSELIKIDPKSIGVGQYQHDVNQKALSSQLDFTVDKIVNEIGVDLNTASSVLLKHISGLSDAIAKNIIKFRDTKGKFSDRQELMEVSKVGAKAFEQAAGFLKIVDGQEALDKTIIHPESYRLTYQILKDNDLNVQNIETKDFKEALNKLKVGDLVNKYHSDEYTITQIITALLNPNFDIRDSVPQPKLKKDILKIEDLTPGLELEGTVRNVVDFGAFVDLGLKNDALLHISKMGKEFISHPSEKLSVNDIIKVKVIDVDLKRNNVAVSLLED
jgi:protein Tex